MGERFGCQIAYAATVRHKLGISVKKGKPNEMEGASFLSGVPTHASRLKACPFLDEDGGL
jgi:hypothetical protein